MHFDKASKRNNEGTRNILLHVEYIICAQAVSIYDNMKKIKYINIYFLKKNLFYYPVIQIFFIIIIKHALKHDKCTSFKAVK